MFIRQSAEFERILIFSFSSFYFAAAAVVVDVVVAARRPPVFNPWAHQMTIKSCRYGQLQKEGLSGGNECRF